MNMKNILKNILVGGVAVAMLASCDLNLFPTTSIPYDEEKPLFLAEADIIQFQNGVMGSYRGLQLGSFTQSIEVMCDNFNATSGYGNNYGSIHKTDMNFTASDTYAESMWANHYGAIKNYNIAIESSKNVAEELVPAADLLRGISLYCRASSYLTLARIFGNAYDSATADTDLCVPLILVYDQLEKPVRATVAEVYDQIYSDLTEAETLLANVPGQVRSMYPTIDAVKALLARYYLDTQDYGNAASYAMEVVNSEAGYALANSLETMTAEFTNDMGTEPVVQLYASQAEGAVSSTLFTGVSQQNGVKCFGSYFLPSTNLINLYDANDLRRLTWLSDSIYPIFMNGTFHEGVTVFVKYLDNPALHAGNIEAGTHAAKPVTVAEMYLIAAEAYAQDGNASAAKDVLNTLQRARMATPTDGTLENIKKEWNRETVGDGQRLACLKRWGDGFNGRPYQEVAKNIVMLDTKGSRSFELKSIQPGDYVLNWPIPSYEIKLSSGLVQNPGYGEE